MDFDLDSLSQKELQKLKADVEKALTTVEERNRKKAMEAAQVAAREYGFSLQELVPGGSGGGKKQNAAKYRNPEDPTQTWAGRGRKPRWLVEALDDGRALEDFEA
jgi:DNA-binding protein H-NS